MNKSILLIICLWGILNLNAQNTLSTEQILKTGEAMLHLDASDFPHPNTQEMRYGEEVNKLDSTHVYLLDINDQKEYLSQKQLFSYSSKNNLKSAKLFEYDEYGKMTAGLHHQGQALQDDKGYIVDSVYNPTLDLWQIRFIHNYTYKAYQNSFHGPAVLEYKVYGNGILTIDSVNNFDFTDHGICMNMLSISKTHSQEGIIENKWERVSEKIGDTITKDFFFNDIWYAGYRHIGHLVLLESRNRYEKTVYHRSDDYSLYKTAHYTASGDPIAYTMDYYEEYDHDGNGEKITYRYGIHPNGSTYIIHKEVINEEYKNKTYRLYLGEEEKLIAESFDYWSSDDKINSISSKSYLNENIIETRSLKEYHGIILKKSTLAYFDQNSPDNNYRYLYDSCTFDNSYKYTSMLFCNELNGGHDFERKASLIQEITYAKNYNDDILTPWSHHFWTFTEKNPVWKYYSNKVNRKLKKPDHFILRKLAIEGSEVNTENAENYQKEFFYSNYIPENQSVEESSSHSFEIYPNPADNKLKITSSYHNNSYQLYNSSGQLLISSDFVQQTDLNVAALKSGIYICVLSSGNDIARKKVVIK